MVALLEPIRAKHDLPALAGAVVTSRGIAAIGSTGMRKRGSGAAVTVHDKWHLGSNTKAMTAILVAALVERGALRWERNLAEAFPELAPSMHPQMRGVNLLHLLSNRSGTAANLRWGEIATAVPGVREQRLRAVTQASRAAPAFAPGSSYLYSNLGFVIAGTVAEQAGKDSWEGLMRRYVFEPLRMRNCGFGGVGTSGQLDQPWGHHDNGRPLDRNGPLVDNPAAMGPAGTAHCTLTEWGNFIADQLRGARGETTLLKPDSYRKLHTPPFGGDYALGWALAKRDWAGGIAVHHNGSNTMNFSVAWLAPAQGYAVIAVTNQGGKRAEAGLDEASGALIGYQRKHGAR